MMEGARRGRPPKIPLEPPTAASTAIATILANWCGIKGCGPRWHEEEAHDIIVLLKQRGYTITKGES